MSAFVLNAKPGEIAETVLMPGDPLRAKYIAETYLSDVRQVTNVRNMTGFTGTICGKPLSVVGHGIGIPSVMIYATDLIVEYGVKRLVRVGSCGTVSNDVKVRDLVIALGASTDSNANRIRFGGLDLAAVASYELLEKVVNAARRADIRHFVGQVFTSDFFHPPKNTEMWEELNTYNIPAVEMEIAGLYGVAAEYGAQAVAMCTVSDEILTGKGLTVEERQLGFDAMIKVALDAIKNFD